MLEIKQIIIERSNILSNTVQELYYLSVVLNIYLLTSRQVDEVYSPEYVHQGNLLNN